jgi:hypothetical protein
MRAWLRKGRRMEKRLADFFGLHVTLPGWLREFAKHVLLLGTCCRSII